MRRGSDRDWGEKRDFRELKCIASTPVKECDISIHQHFLRMNIVVIAVQASCLTFIFIEMTE